jgi:hypothetical protein
MSDVEPETYQNVYLQNVVTGATPNPMAEEIGFVAIDSGGLRNARLY